MLERRHCHPLYILERSVKSLVSVGVYLILSFVSAFNENEGDSIYLNPVAVFAIIGGAVLLIGLIVLCTWLSWRNRWISAEDNTLIYEWGILVKRRMTIPFSKINTIDMGRNLFQRIVGTCRLKVDTGAISDNTEENAEMDLVFSVSDAEIFRNYILGRAAADEQILREVSDAPAIIPQSEPGWAARARFTDFLLYGLTSSSVWKLFLTVLTVVIFVSELSTSFIEKAMDWLFPYAELAWNTVMSHGIIIIILVAVLIAVIMSLVVNLISVLTAAIKFYDFRIAREGDNVVVRYGLLTVKNYTVQTRNIHAIVINQNLFQQMIGRCSIEMISIGYGNEEQESSLLFPIISLKKLPWLIETLLPEYSIKADLVRTDKRAVRFHIIRPIVWSALVLGIAASICSVIMESPALPVIVFVLLMASITLGSVLNYKNAAIGCSDKNMIVCSGGTRKSTHVIRLDAVQSVGRSAGIFQRRKKLATYRVDFHAPALKSIAMVKHMDDGLMEKFVLRIVD